MKALLSREPGPPETLRIEDLADPVAGTGQLLIRVKACGVNYPDVLIIEDKYQVRPPRPFAPGAEVSGTVAAVGDGVVDFAPGDRVMALCSSGGMAELAAVDARRCVRMPDAMPFDEAAALLLTHGTSYHALVETAEIKAGQTVLVLGAAGGVGLAAVEIAKALGARVIAGVSSEARGEVARARGADDILVYPRGPFDRDARRALAGQIRDACGGGADVVLDPVGGDYSEAALRALRPGGKLVVIGFVAGIASIPLNLVLLKQAHILGTAFGAVVATRPERFQEIAKALVALYAEGAVRPMVSERLPLERGPEAIARLAAREATGKLVVTVG